MKPSFRQSLLIIVLMLVSCGDGLGETQERGTIGTSKSSFDTLRASTEIYKLLFRDLLESILAQSSLDPSHKLVFLSTGGSGEKGLIGPVDDVSESLSDLNITIADAKEFHWSDSCGCWHHSPTNRIGFNCFVHIAGWISKKEVEATVGIHWGEDLGQTHKVRVTETSAGWKITRKFDFWVY